PEGRRRMVSCVVDDGWTIEATAERFQVDAKTVRKWRDRFLVEGSDGLFDRSSRPHTSPKRTRRSTHRKVLRLRRKRRWGADRVRGWHRGVDRAAHLAGRGLRSTRSRGPGKRPYAGAALRTRTPGRAHPCRCQEDRCDPGRWRLVVARPAQRSAPRPKRRWLP